MKPAYAVKLVRSAFTTKMLPLSGTCKCIEQHRLCNRASLVIVNAGDHELGKGVYTSHW